MINPSNSIDAAGLATAQTPGSTRIQGLWTTFLWDLNPNMTCTKTRIDPLAEALCDVVTGVAVGAVSFTSPSPPVIRNGEAATLTVVLSGSPDLTGTAAVTVEAAISDASGPVDVTVSPASQAIGIGANQTTQVTFSFRANSAPAQSQTLKGRIVVTTTTPNVTIVDGTKKSSNDLTIQRFP